MTLAQLKSTFSDKIQIEGVDNLTILNYFRTFNAQDFQATTDLFTVDGVLQPPFESPIQGKEAIASYLKTEAKGMKVFPVQGVSEEKDNNTYISISGKVKNSLFTVNVTWDFILNTEKQITYVEVTLKASLEELITIRPQAQ